MHKLIAPLRWIKLNNPVHIWNIDTSGCQVSCQKNGTGSIFSALIGKFLPPKLLVNLRSLLLPYFPMQLRDIMTPVPLLKNDFQGLVMEINRSTSAEKYDQALSRKRVYKAK